MSKLTKEQALKNEYKEKGYTTTQVAKVLNISRRNLYNFLEGNITNKDTYNRITKLIKQLRPLYNVAFMSMQPSNAQVEEALNKELDIEELQRTVDWLKDNSNRMTLDRNWQTTKIKIDILYQHLIDLRNVLSNTPSTPTEEEKTKVFVSYFYTLGNRASGQGSLVFENVDIIEDYVHIEQLSNKIDEKLNKQYDCEDSKSVVTNFKILRKRVE